jgi:hypothetical protein
MCISLEGEKALSDAPLLAIPSMGHALAKEGGKYV